VPSRRAPLIPSVLDICPLLRRRARRAAVEIRQLLDTLIVAFPDAALLARDPGIAERIDTTRFDHVAADLIRAARALTEAISALDEPP
jgi:hypothetical protein